MGARRHLAGPYWVASILSKLLDYPGALSILWLRVAAIVLLLAMPHSRMVEVSCLRADTSSR